MMGGNRILSPEEFNRIKTNLFVPLRFKDDILSNLSLQEDMKQWILHHITEAKTKDESSVDVRVWSESAKNPLGCSNDALISWIKSQGYSAVINAEKTYNNVTPYVRTVFVSISWE